MKRMIAGLVTSVVLLMPARSQAQMLVQRIDDPPRLSAYWEMGGNTGGVSVNLDLLVEPHTSIRAGGFYVGGDSTYWNRLLMVNQLFGDKGHYLEVGGGFVATSGTIRSTNGGPTVSLGYRHQTRSAFYRVGYAATSTGGGGRDWRPTLAFSVGHAF